MKSEELLRSILPDVLLDNFEVVDYTGSPAKVGGEMKKLCKNCF